MFTRLSQTHFVKTLPHADTGNWTQTEFMTSESFTHPFSDFSPQYEKIFCAFIGLDIHIRTMAWHTYCASPVQDLQGINCWASEWTLQTAYRKNPKISDIWKFAVITLKVEQDRFSSE